MFKYLFAVVLAFTAVFVTVANPGSDTTLYREQYRPQYHFTPAHRWIGDPCGLIKTDSVYLAYSWGGAKSKDLLHWHELNHHAIKGLPPRVSTFTGSVVIDSANTAGFGPGALVAVYTSFDEDSKKQSQSIAFSRDGGVTYQDYDQNPVLDIWSTEFRDPTVIWHEPSGQWVMLVARALQKKIGIYGSRDLKHWDWLSDFGPLGDAERSWECPDVFQLPVPGHPEQLKWVMVVSINWAREQYFIGEFDGKNFIADTPEVYPLYVDEGLDYYASRVFQGYEPGSPVSTLGWVNTWDYAPTAPSRWGKGIWSLPREYTLVETPEGLRLAQTPIKAVETLRGESWHMSRRLSAGITPLPKVAAMGNTYEMQVKFSDLTSTAGLYLCEGSGHRLSIAYDPLSGFLTIDRTNSTPEKIGKFKRVAVCDLGKPTADLELRIFVDKSTVEIFTADGLHTMTLLTFAADGQDGASLWSTAPGRVDLTAWPLKSVW